MKFRHPFSINDFASCRFSDEQTFDPFWLAARLESIFKGFEHRTSMRQMLIALRGKNLN